MGCLANTRTFLVPEKVSTLVFLYAWEMPQWRVDPQSGFLESRTRKRAGKSTTLGGWFDSMLQYFIRDDMSLIRLMSEREKEKRKAR